MYGDCDTGEMGGRFAADTQNENSTIQQTDDWQIKIYPNPAQDRITLLNSNANEVLNISVTDLTGRVITKQKVKTENFVVDINLSLLNGVYMLTVTNSENKTTVKKLLIAK